MDFLTRYLNVMVSVLIMNVYKMSVRYSILNHNNYLLFHFQDNITYGHVYGHHKEWNDVILPAAPSDAYNQQMSYLIRGLDPGAQYEAQVQAKNKFGWNKISDKFQFTTRGVGKYLFLKKEKTPSRSRSPGTIVNVTLGQKYLAGVCCTELLRFVSFSPTRHLNTISTYR